VALSTTVSALGPTTVDPCRPVFPRAGFHTTNAAVKLRTLLEPRGAIPAAIHISAGELHDVYVLVATNEDRLGLSASRHTLLPISSRTLFAEFPLPQALASDPFGGHPAPMSTNCDGSSLDPLPPGGRRFLRASLLNRAQVDDQLEDAPAQPSLRVV
jgi:hypothetical protein